ncbi:hypothetical protein BGX30_014426 [Mortierella sp. GBA39]|nr:hypothetical protein BGX30_014426 [Mortierella sp. GBA39]
MQIKGTYGTCFRAVLKGTSVAIKISYCSNDKRRAIYKKEAEIMKLVDSKHVVRYMDHFQVDELGIIAMEYCTGGSVKSKLVVRWTDHKLLGLSEDSVAPLMANVAEAFIYLHETQGLVHRDLKPENVVIDASGLAKVCDLGQSFYLQDGLETITWGTTGYLPPEVLQNAEYGEKIDVYAFGVMVHCLLLGTTPKHKDLDSLNLGDMTEPAKRLIEDCAVVQDAVVL